MGTGRARTPRRGDELADTELLARVQDDPQALEALYRRHAATITRYALRRCESADDVADLVASTFVAVIESAGTFDARRGEVVAWMLGIAGHLVGDHVRSAARERKATARLGGFRELDDDSYRDLETQLDAVRQRPELEHALRALSPLDREIVWLADHDGLAQDLAAHVVGLSHAAFRMRLMRARRELRRRLRASSSDGTRILTSDEVTGDARP